MFLSSTKAEKFTKWGPRLRPLKQESLNLTRSLQTYGVNAIKEEGLSSAFDRQRQLRWSYSHIVEEYIVGLDEDIKEVVVQLINEDKHFQVVSICGMGGLGKTTLAKKVYHHSDVRRHFEGFAWAYISQQCKTRDVWEGILVKLTSPTKDERDQILKMTHEELAKKLNQVQQEKRCLVILDDIWSTEAWDLLSPAFPSGQTSEICEDMEKLGREMVVRCAGLPLAIIVLGGLLATKETLDEWDIVHRNIKSHLGRGREQGQQSRVHEVLALSYHELPYQLKPCFLYLSHFPEDFDIPAKKLVRLWVAEGFVSPKYELEGDEMLEDFAERCLVELINRCMVQVGITGSSGRIKSCRLHDLMRDLCLSKAKQENFLHIVSPWSRNEKADSSTGKIRRLAIFSEEFLTMNYYKENHHIRSLIYFKENSQLIKSVFKYLKLLRVLDLEGIQLLDGDLTEEIGSLIHLRFLSLKKTRIRVLPSSIGNLVCLETLNLETIEELSWESTVLIPIEIWKMKQLRHLYLPKWCNYLTDDKLQLANLSNLQTLVNFPTNKCDARDLLSLTNLKKLVLNDPRDFQDFGEIFNPPNKKLNSLRSLTMKTEMLSFPDKVVDVGQVVQGCPRLHKLHIEGRINKLPDYQEFPPYLSKLTLWGSRLVEDPMPVLEKLPNLRVLRGWGAFIGKQMVCSDKGFPQLKSLLLRGLPNLQEWTVEAGAMPSLFRLEISDCNKLVTAPHGLKFVSMLQELEIRWMPRAFKHRLEEGGEDFYIVQHVPSIIFLN
uniref:NB-ARC domain-containing protein n=1 Tax=Fagus sylvatica TaxID=28930 RepID=A0A2N9HXH1_FAGSY